MDENISETKTKKVKDNPKPKHIIPIEPYPITFRTQTPSPVNIDTHYDNAGRSYISGRRRRQSKEFEDLSINTGSGSLSHIHEHSEFETSPRRRVYSMSQAHNPRYRKQHGASSNSSTPRTSPDLRRKLLTKKGGHSSGSSKESLNEPVERLSSMDELHWVGDPEAIHSVRRHRKTVEEQELDSEMHKLMVT